MVSGLIERPLVGVVNLVIDGGKIVDVRHKFANAAVDSQLQTKMQTIDNEAFYPDKNERSLKFEEVVSTAQTADFCEST